jgi:putative membrane protein
MPSTDSLRPSPSLPASLLAATLVLLAWSGYKPFDYLTWGLEVFPAVLGMVILLATYRRFPLTPLVYWLVAVHMAILIVGGHYTYANVPIGNWFKETFDLSRNHYDRMAHVAQGFVPAMIAREVLLRNTPLKAGAWLFFIVLGMCMGISAVYELVEWLVAEIDSAGSQEFLGTQGDVWDTQKDMALCGVGATSAMLLLNRLHDRQLRKLLAPKTPRTAAG